MGIRQRLWAKTVKRRLLLDLGARCARCPATATLEFDCIEPRGHTHHALGYADRMAFYLRQFRSGNLQLLCNRCHRIKTAEDVLIVISHED